MQINKLLFSTLLATSMCSGSAYAIDLKASLQRPSPVVVNAATAQSDDVKSIDGIVAALYDVISGSVGQARDWNRMRSLFILEAHTMCYSVENFKGLLWPHQITDMKSAKKN